MSFNYSYWKSRFKPMIVEREEDLPTGNWQTVATAAELSGLSETCLRQRAFRGEIESAKITCKGSLLLDCDSIDIPEGH